MKPHALRAFLILALAGALQAGQIEAPVSGEFAPGMRSGGVGSSLGAPTPIQLTVPSLTGTSEPNLALALALAPAPALAQPAIRQLQTAKPQALPVLPVSVVTPAPSQRRMEGVLPRLMARPDESGADAGRVLFDQSGARSADTAVATGGLWVRIKNRLSLGEAAPAWPGKAGDPVRIGRVKTVLDKPIGDGGTAKVWQSQYGHYAITLLHPGAGSDRTVRRGSAPSAHRWEGTGLPVAKLLAESRDGKVLVKEFIEGATASEILERGAFSRPQAEGWPELAAKLIKADATADLARGNLIWQHWRTRWVIVDAGSLAHGGPKAVLDQMMAPELLSRAGVDPAAFLSGLRARLGPDSGPWAKTLEGLRGSKAGSPAVAALARRDVASQAGPALTFGPAPKGPAGLDDTIVSGAEAARRIGYDPLQAKTQIKLHGDDPGKLNTTILAVAQPGKTPVVVKLAQWDIIRNEVALRRLARRFFGRYFRTPASVAVKQGRDSFLVMEKIDASASYYKGAFDKEQRVAAALFIRTFGVSDVNPGNVLAAGDKGLPWLIDFEQAFSRVEPVAGRIPDERIALEMPWMSLETRNRVEDYQPGVRAWRAFLKTPEVRAAILGDLAVSGFSPAETAGLLARFDLNADDLDWTLQNDADFVNQFIDRKAAQR